MIPMYILIILLVYCGGGGGGGGGVLSRFSYSSFHVIVLSHYNFIFSSVSMHVLYEMKDIITSLPSEASAPWPSRGTCWS